MRVALLFAATTLIAVGLARTATSDEAPPPPVQPPLPKLPTGKDLMAAKVKNAQTLLEALSVEDYGRMQTSAEELGRISRPAEFLNAHGSAEYAVRIKLFQQTVDALAAHAKAKNLDGATLAYIDMSMSCVKCHQSTRTREDARRPTSPPTGGVGR